MNVKDEPSCKICSNAEGYTGLLLIDDVTRNMLNVILPKMDLNVTKDPVICNNCADITQKLYQFKSACIDTEKKIFCDESAARCEVKSELDDSLRCQLCTCSVDLQNCSFIEVLRNDTTSMELISKCITVLDLNIPTNGVICKECRDNLERYMDFIHKCTSIEDKILAYKVVNNTDQVRLTDLNSVLAKNNLDTPQDSSDVIEIKQEQESECLVSLKSEEDLTIKDEHIDVNKDIFGTTNNQSDDQNCVWSDRKPYKCHICSHETSEKEYLWKHMLVHGDVSEENMFKCTLCNYKGKRKHNLTTHMLSHKNPTETKMYKCQVCSFQTKYKQGLKLHSLVHEDPSRVNLYKCSHETCTYETKNKKNLTSHMASHKPKTNLKMTTYINDSGITMFKCTYKSPERETCPYETKNKALLRKHSLTHKSASDVVMFKCEACTYETKRLGSMKQHVLTHKDATEVETFKCLVCPFTTKHKVYIKHHMLVHKDVSEVETFECSECSFRTRYKHFLKKHESTHKDGMNVEIFQCAKCPYETNKKYNLKSHVLVHRSVSEVEMYKCENCQYETKHKYQLKKHQLIHKAASDVKLYQCTKCVFMTRWRSHINRHMKTHN